MDDVSCTNTNITFTDIPLGPTVGGTSWNFEPNTGNALPLLGVNNPDVTQYTSVGRYDILHTGNTYEGFTNVILNNASLPTISTNAPFVNGAYRVCAGGRVRFSANEGGVGYIYHWDLGGGAIPNSYIGSTYENLNSIIFNTPGIYTVQLNYETNCCGLSLPAYITISVEDLPLPVMPTGLFCAGAANSSALSLSGLTPNGTVLWTPNTSLDRDDSTTVIASPTVLTNYVVTLTDSTGICSAQDSVLVNLSTMQNLDTSICIGESFLTPLGNNITPINDTTFIDSFLSTTLCDSLFNVSIVVNDFTIENIDTTICQGQDLTINGTTYNIEGVYNDTVRYIISACDSIQYVINLSIDSFIVENIDTTICQGQIFSFNSNSYSASGQYFDTLRYTNSNCDSIQYIINVAIDSFVVENIDTIICQGQSLIVNGISYNQTGLFNDTARYSSSFCDSIHYIIDLRVDSFVVENIDTTICQGQSLIINGVSYTASGIYNDTARYSTGNCDSIQYVISLVIDSVVVENIDTTICQGQSLTFNGTTYSASGIYNDTLRYNASSCDSVQYVINLGIDSFIVDSIQTNVGQGQSITVNSITYDSTGIYLDTVRYASSSCDSIQYVIDLTVDSFSIENIDTTICQGQDLTINGATYTTNGLYFDTVKYSLSTSDSIQYVINLNIDSFTIENIDTTICQGQSIVVNGMTYNGTGLYNDTARYSASNCDSIQYVINLVVDSVSIVNIDTTICQGQTLTVNGLTYSSTGLYNDTLRHASLCDSIQFVINLNIDSFTVENIDTTICQGQSLIVNGVYYNVNGLYYDTARNTISNCDSIQYIVNLAIDSFVVENIDTTICQGQDLTVNGVTYNSTGNYNDTAHYSLNGCDSIQYVIDLQIDSFVVETIDTSICQGQTLTVNGLTYTATGIYRDTLSYVLSSCDSIQYVIDLNIDSFVVETIDTTICQGQSIVVNGISYNGTGVYNDTARYSASDCDSIQYFINLEVDSFVVETIDTTICQGQSLVVNGITYSASGIYNDTARHGLSSCDSIQYVIILAIDSFVIENVDTTICEGQSISVNGTNYNATGIYNDTARYTASNCDSVQYIVNLVVNNVMVDSITSTIGQGQSLMVNGVTYDSTGVYLDTARYTISNCDSIQFVIDLTVDSFSIINIDTSICQGQSLTVNGTTYTSNGLYYDTIQYSAHASDSIQYVIDLNIDSFVVETIDTIICQGQSIVINGISYNGTGMYNDTARYGASNCDSIQYNVNLLVDSVSIINVDTNICQGQTLTVNGITYNSSGLYNDTLRHASMCDSIQYVIDLVIDSFVVENVDTTICEGQSISVNGTTYNAAGIYNDTARYIASNCDSIQYVINLVVNDVVIDSVVNTIGQGQSIIVNGVSYDSTGVYLDTARYAFSNCDSIQFVIDLTVDSFNIINIDTILCQGQSLTVNGATYTSDGLYYDTIQYSTHASDSIQFVINLNIDSFTVENIDTTICQGQTLTVNGITYTANGLYNDTARYILSNCDSMQYVINLAIDSFVVENIDTTICQGQTLTVNGNTYVANGLYNDTAFYSQSSCDSIQYVINLAIDSFVIENIDSTVCQGQTLTVNGVTYTNSGLYNDTARYSVSSCDSIQYVINLVIDSFVVENIDTTIVQGQSITVNGVSYDYTGVYNDTIRYGLSNCDSIQYVIDLTVDSFVVINIDTAICQGQMLTVNNVNYTASGLYYDTIRYTVSNSDSIRYVIDLTIDSFLVENIDTTICQGQTLTVNGITYTANGLYSDTARYTLSNCDSIQYVINLAIDSFVVENIDTTICQGQTLTVNGITYTANGLYNDTARYSTSNCDSIQYVINLAIDSFVIENIDTTICQGQTLMVNGVAYTASGLYNDTASYAMSNCDSIQFVINLAIDSFAVEVTDTAICQGDTIAVNGVDYFTSGSYTDSIFYSPSTCLETLFIIDLIVNPLPIVSANSDAVDSSVCVNELLTLFGGGDLSNTYSWDNRGVDNQAFNLTEGFSTYVVNGIDSNLCQNFDTITVQGLAIFTDTINVAICEDETYVLPDGIIVNQPGEYITVLSSVANCDSTITTILTVNQLGNFMALNDSSVCDNFVMNVDLATQNMVNIEWFVNDGSGLQTLVGNLNYNGADTDLLSFNLDTSLHQNVYEVQMLDECGNTLSTNMTLEVYEPHLVANPLSDTVFCEHEIDVVTIDYNGFDYVWNTGDVGPKLLVQTSGEYIVSYTENGSNCAMTDTIQIDIEDCVGNCVVLAPTGFSPNGNGTNDIFRVVTTCDEGFSSFEFSIYNRWGELVYYTNDWQQGWDGSFKGRSAQLGTYTYYVEYIKELSIEKESLKGSVTLLK